MGRLSVDEGLPVLAVIPLPRSGLHCGNLGARDPIFTCPSRHPAPKERAPLRPVMLSGVRSRQFARHPAPKERAPLRPPQAPGQGDGRVVIPLPRSGLHCGALAKFLSEQTGKSSRSQGAGSIAAQTARPSRSLRRGSSRSQGAGSIAAAWPGP